MERRIIQESSLSDLNNRSEEEMGIQRIPQTAEEAMSDTEEKFLAFVNEQIEKMDKKLLFWGDSSPPFSVLNKALLDHSHVMLALTSLYEHSRIEVSKAKEIFDEWHAIKFLEIRTQVNRDDIAKNKWYSEKEIEYMIRSKYKSEYAIRKSEYELAESKRSTLQRMIDSWASYQYILSQLSRNTISENVSVRSEGYIE